MLENGIELLSWLPPGGENLFAAIKALMAKRKEEDLPIYDLSIGQPKGPAPLPARKAAARAIMSPLERMHGYQDNGCPAMPKFARLFVNFHTKVDVRDIPGVKFLTTPGTKPMLGLPPLASGAAQRKIKVLTTTDPGYSTPADWCGYLGVDHQAITLSPENDFRVDVDDIRNSTFASGGYPDLIMLNFPHNPSAQTATREMYEPILGFAQEEGIRVVNDAAYSILSHIPDHCTLADVAKDFPGLSWAEIFSNSKAGNLTGWPISAFVGSGNFIDDIAKIKGNTDSGPFGPGMIGTLNLYQNHMELIQEVQAVYKRRMDLLISVLKECGMQLAVHPGAGFFILCNTPKVAFGQAIKDAKDFNLKMIEKTGIVGVHFHPYYRLAVCGDVEAKIDPIAEGFKEAAVKY